MITIIHGDDIASSIKKRDELVHKDVWVVALDGDKSKLAEVLNAFEGQELFTTKKIILFEHINKFPKKELDEIISRINQCEKNEDIEIIIWNDTSFTKPFLTKLKGKAVEFPLPKYFFTFLDSFTPKNGKTLHELLVKLEKSFSSEQIYYALIKRIRMILILKTGKENEFKDFQTMSSWQRSKLKQQARLWELDKIVSIYKNLFEIELGMKTSSLPLALSEHLDLLILKV